jgi:hypothetical protein
MEGRKMCRTPDLRWSQTAPYHVSRKLPERQEALPANWPVDRERLRLAINSSVAKTDRITDVIVTDISEDGLSPMAGGALTAGMRVMVDVPLIGMREAEIRWISECRAGCRLMAPLDDEELRTATCRSAALARYFPGLVARPSAQRMAA